MIKNESVQILSGEVRKKTLSDFAPKITFLQRMTRASIAVFIVGILIFSYIWCGISPLKLWIKRGNAFEYLFGRPITETDRRIARRQAERFPEIMAFEEARIQITREYNAFPVKEQPSNSRKNEAIERLAKEILEQQDPMEKEEIVKTEYVRILDEKRGGYFPPEIHPSRLKSYLTALLETVMIAIWGSLLAVVAAILLSLFAAKNILEIIAPGDSILHRSIRWISYFIARRFLDICRGFDLFVMALIFVAIIGLGPFAGILALFFHTAGILGKVFSEAIEAIEPRQVEALSSTGGGSAQIISFAAIPQIMPTIISYSLLRFESNVRSATILGFCGAGGIGFLLFDKLRGYQYREVCTIMIMIIIAVSIIDYVCARLRGRFI